MRPENEHLRQLASYAHTLQGRFPQQFKDGLANRVFAQQVTPEDLATLQQFQPHASPQEQPQIQALIGMLQGQTGQAVQQVIQAAPQMTVNTLDREVASQGMALQKGSLNWLKQHPGILPQEARERLSAMLKTQSEVALEGLFMYLSAANQALTPEQLIVGLALMDLLRQSSTPKWLNKIDGNRRQWFVQNIQATNKEVPTMAVPRAQNGRAVGPGHTQVSSSSQVIGHPKTEREMSPVPARPQIPQLPKHPSLPQFPAANGNGSAIESGLFAGFEVDSGGPNGTKALHPQDTQAVVNPHESDELAFEFDAFAAGPTVNSVTPPAPTGPLSPEALGACEYYVIVQNLTKEWPGEQQQAPFGQRCLTVMAAFVEKQGINCNSMAIELLRHPPTPAVVMMIQAFTHTVQSSLPQLQQKAQSDPSMRTFVDKWTQEYTGSLAMRVASSSTVLSFIDQLKKDANAVKAVGKRLGDLEYSDGNAPMIEALCAAFELTNKDQIPDAVLKPLHNIVEALKVKKDLAPSLLQVDQQGRKNGWILRNFLAAGGMGAVFLADEVRYGKLTGRKAAVKIAKVSDDDARAGFEREVVLLSGMEGRHIVNVYGAGTSKANAPYLVMEYVQGPEAGSGAFDGDALIRGLKAAQEAGKPLPYDALSIVSWRLALGIQEFRTMDILHRDLKPANFLLTQKAARAFVKWAREELNDEQLTDALHQLIDHGDPIIKWTDFGLAKKTAGQPQNAQASAVSVQSGLEALKGVGTSFTLAGGDIVGTPIYLPPEVITNAPPEEGKDLYTHADAYALGKIMFELFTGGEQPFKWTNDQAVMLVMQDLMQMKPQGRNALVDDSDGRIAPLKEHDHLRKMPALMSRLTHIQDPTKRGKIRETVALLEKMVRQTSSDAREKNVAQKSLGRERKKLRAARQHQEKISTRNKVLAGLLSVSAVVVLGLVLKFAFKRPDEYVEFGGQRKATYTAMAQALEEDSTSIQQLRDLLARYQQEEASRPSGYEPVEGEPGAAELKALIQRVETEVGRREEAERNLAAARALISEGDRLLVQETPDFDGARAKYREAQEKSSGLAEVVRGKLEEVDRVECGSLYILAIKSYEGVPLNKSFPDIVSATTQSQSCFSRFFDKVFKDIDSEQRPSLITRLKEMSHLNDTERHRILSEVDSNDPLKHILSSELIDSDKILKAINKNDRLSNWIERLRNVDTVIARLVECNHEKAMNIYERVKSSDTHNIFSELAQDKDFESIVIPFSASDNTAILSESFVLLIRLGALLDQQKAQELRRIQRENPEKSFDQIVNDCNSAPERFPRLLSIVRQIMAITDAVSKLTLDGENSLTINPGSTKAFQDFQYHLCVDVLTHRIRNNNIGGQYPTTYSLAQDFISRMGYLKASVNSHESSFIIFRENESFHDGFERVFRSTLNDLNSHMMRPEKERLINWMKSQDHLKELSTIAQEVLLRI